MEKKGGLIDMTLDKDDKEFINLTIEHFLTKSLPPALAQHIKDCPIAGKFRLAKWTIIGLALGIGIVGGNIGIKEFLRLFGINI